MKNRLVSNLFSPFVSVIIPVLNDAARLKNCLEALENQTYPKSLYEVIVVDNDSDEGIEGLVSQFGQAVATYESRRSSYAARNKGISIAKGEIIAFTDADCIPALDWIEKGVANLLRVLNCGLVAGRIKIFVKDPAHPTPVELFETLTAFPQKSYVEELRFGATANIFTFRSVIDDVGLFDDALKSGGDRQWGERVFAAGYKQIYADDTCVAHPARYSLKQLHKKIVRVNAGIYDLNKKEAHSILAVIREVTIDLKPPLRGIYRVLSDVRLKENDHKIKIILILLFFKYATVWEKIYLHMKNSFLIGSK